MGSVCLSDSTEMTLYMPALSIYLNVPALYRECYPGIKTSFLNITRANKYNLELDNRVTNISFPR